MPNTNRLSRLMESTRPWLTDGGLETDMLFNHGVDLPSFASFTMLDDAKKRDLLSAYFAEYIGLAADTDVGFILDTCSWRANAPWMSRMGYANDAIARINADAIAFAREIRDRHETPSTPILINGVVGPAGDGYIAADLMSVEQAMATHSPQVSALGEHGVDIVSAITMNYVEEAIGVATLAARTNLPVVVSFTVETDGNLPSGQPLADAIMQTDRALQEATGQRPIYYMINCAHPDHFIDRLKGSEVWKARIGGVRANASRQSHAELDESEVLDDGNPTEFGELYAQLSDQLPALKVIGGCCGTDSRHVGCALHAINHPVEV